MKTLSRELAPEIRANAILPGSHETNRIKNIIESQLERGEFDSYEEALDFRSKNIPFKRLGKPEELGDLVAFLSSGKSSYINGAAVVIDGGGGRSNL
ncbi:enoyl-ACP reductase-like protein [Halanaerobium sp. MA284_MarDTE_T2]|nr:enoyl-ACP reductase-like protein [Halanaerobium sp. MA284_MarDTE_T2]RCW81134.1 enoyl-ACP reductase-like protein [Halanaerobium sp. DL-01]